jgi:hypothetical protein
MNGFGGKFFKGDSLDLHKLFIAKLYNTHTLGTYKAILGLIFSKGQKLRV